MVLGIRTLVLGAALLACATPALAQTRETQRATDGGDIVVTGRLDPPTLTTEIRRFVRGHARLSRIDQIARWREPICVNVINLPEAYGSFIANRIAAVAREAGAPAQDRAGCTPNVSIVFTTEPQALINSIRAENPQMLGYHALGERDAVATMTRPIQAWHVTATSNGHVTALDEPMRDPPSGMAGSRLTNRLSSVFVHALIVVNQSEVADAPIGPIADYLAMMALTDIRDERWGCGGLVTILELFSQECPSAPQELTISDRAFLQGLYSMDEEAIASLQRGRIAGVLQDALGDGEP
ncbi:MAG: hypothetical protein JNL81_03585 [Hyphomonadaceae bacterium]|nr:hypothetical protein [Hyphomonadaceae bacterium]